MGDGLLSFQFYTFKAQSYSCQHLPGWEEGKGEMGKVKQNSQDKIQALNILHFSRRS